MIRTARLVPRPWRDSDLAPFAAMSADPEVMRYLGGTMTRAASDAHVGQIRIHFKMHGFCKWAVEAPGIAPFVGTVGLSHKHYDAFFTPAVEVAWRLDRRFWGMGFATEAARAAMADGFARAGLTEIVAVTALENVASARAMERFGMARSGEFDHPLVAEGSPLRRHVLYRLGR